MPRKRSQRTRKQVDAIAEKGRSRKGNRGAMETTKPRKRKGKSENLSGDLKLTAIESDLNLLRAAAALLTGRQRRKP